MAVKPTKVLCMNENVAYSDWKKEVNIWMKTNIPLGVNKTVLAGRGDKSDGMLVADWRE